MPFLPAPNAALQNVAAAAGKAEFGYAKAGSRSGTRGMSIIGTWLELPVVPLLLLLAAFYLATGTIIHLLSFYGPTGRWCANFKGLFQGYVGPFFTLNRSEQGSISQAIDRTRLDAALALRTTRADRLLLAGDRTDELKWATILLLAVVAQLAIAVVHLERRYPQIGALAIFSGAVVIALGLVALQERPFAGPLQISSDALSDVLGAIPAQ